MSLSQLILLFAAITTAGFIRSASASLILYEGFDYSAGTINGSQNTGTGFNGAWNASGSNILAVESSGLTFPGLTVTGGSVARPTPSGNSEMNRALTSGSIMNLTSGTIYFSTLIRANNISGNANAGLVFGTDLVDASQEPLGVTSGGSQEGFGFSIENRALYAIGFDDGASLKSSGSLSVSLNTTEATTTFMIVGQIDWGATDNLTLYNISDVTAPLPASFATVSGSLDESAFDTLALGDRQISSIDEIRFGTTLAAVGIIPEPSSLALLCFGGLALIMRRREWGIPQAHR